MHSKNTASRRLISILDVSETGCISILDVSGAGCISIIDVSETCSISNIEVSETGCISILDVSETGCISILDVSETGYISVDVSETVSSSWCKDGLLIWTHDMKPIFISGQSRRTGVCECVCVKGAGLLQSA